MHTYGYGGRRHRQSILRVYFLLQVVRCVGRSAGIQLFTPVVHQQALVINSHSHFHFSFDSDPPFPPPLFLHHRSRRPVPSPDLVLLASSHHIPPPSPIHLLTPSFPLPLCVTSSRCVGWATHTAGYVLCMRKGGWLVGVQVQGKWRREEPGQVPGTVLLLPTRIKQYAHLYIHWVPLG